MQSLICAVLCCAEQTRILLRIQLFSLARRRDLEVATTTPSLPSLVFNCVVCALTCVVLCCAVLHVCVCVVVVQRWSSWAWHSVTHALCWGCSGARAARQRAREQELQRAALALELDLKLSKVCVCCALRPTSLG